MNKLFKAVAIIGNVSEVIIASSLVADMVAKFRGLRKATDPEQAKQDAEPETPMAA